MSLPDETAESVKEFVFREVHGGFTPLDEIVEAAAEYVSDEAEAEDVIPYAQRCLEEAIAQHDAQQQAWAATTDCDRLDTAFAALDAAGVVARQNFTCCQTCGVAEMKTEVAGRARHLPSARGYTFYHQQDTEGAVDGGGLFLTYGATGGPAEASVQIGHEVVAALRAAGLDPVWDGTVRKRIRVPLEWQRRR